MIDISKFLKQLDSIALSAASDLTKLGIHAEIMEYPRGGCIINFTNEQDYYLFKLSSEFANDRKVALQVLGCLQEPNRYKL